MIIEGARRVPSRVSGLPELETIKRETACARRGYGGCCSGLERAEAEIVAATARSLLAGLVDTPDPAAVCWTPG